MSGIAQKIGGLVLLVMVAVVVLLLDGGDGTTEPGVQIEDPGSQSTAVEALLDLPVPDDDRTWRGTIEHISDGDTLIARVTDPGGTELRVGDDVRVRLLRVDTPEEQREGAVAECFADEATAILEQLLPEDSVATFHRDEEATDQYGRELAHVFNAQGQWVNGQLLALGAAKMVTFRPNVAHDVRVTSLEQTAKVLRQGLWGAC